jgi:zinc and cadmium transporter
MIDSNLQLFLWILGSGLLMSAISLLGAVTFVIPERILRSLLLPLVSIAAGSLIGSSLFYLLPESIEAMGNNLSVYGYVVIGFLIFFVLEQFLHWHHTHDADEKSHQHHKPLGYLILMSHGVHNLIDGIAVGGSFLVDPRIGIFAWVGVAMHEIPQKLGDYSILLHSGWAKRKALMYNFLSSLAFPVGGLLVFFLARAIDITFLLPFTAGMFLYVAAVDLVPEIKHHHRFKTNVIHFLSFIFGLGIILLFRLQFEHHH